MHMYCLYHNSPRSPPRTRAAQLGMRIRGLVKLLDDESPYYKRTYSYVYPYIYIYHIYIYIYMYICTYIYIYTHTYTSLSLSLYIYIYIYKCTVARTAAQRLSASLREVLRRGGGMTIIIIMPIYWL